MSETIKIAVLEQISWGASWRPEGRASYRFPGGLVHARFKTSGPFSFNINPATLKADFELWICGSQQLFYLLPQSVIKKIYYNPDSYEDKRHPKIRVVSVDTVRHRATFARGGQSIQLKQYLKATLPAVAV